MALNDAEAKYPQQQPSLPIAPDPVEETLRFIAHQGWHGSQKDFFIDLAIHLAETLGVAHVFINRLVEGEPPSVQSLAGYSNGQIVDNIAYELPDTPCGKAMLDGFTIIQDRIVEEYPLIPWLEDFKAVGYVGMPLLGNDGIKLGIISILHNQPIKNTALVGTVLKIVAIRAAAELERRKILLELQESRQRFVDFATSSSDWFWEMDEKLRFTYFSERFTEITGVRQTALLGKTRQESGIERLADPETLRKHLADLDAHRPFRNFVHSRLKPDGSEVFVAISGQPVFSASGEFKGYRGNGRDITSQMQSAATRDQALKDAQEANLSKTRFLANMSHDLRTPLNAILGFSDMIRSNDVGNLPTSKYKDYANDIHNSANYLLDLVNDLLDISAIETGNRALRLKELSIVNVITNSVNDVQEAAATKNISITQDISDGIPQVMGDSRAIRRIAQNILSNAVKFTEPGGRIAVTAQHVDAAVEVAISDTGIGFTEEEIERVCTPFYQREEHPYHAESGWGLGLAIAASLVQLHNGHLDIESTRGEGSTLTFSIPVSVR